MLLKPVLPVVEYVVNYDLPDVAENYVHRVGRTGRGTKRGIAISFCSEEEKPLLKDIEVFMDKKVDVSDIENAEYEAILATTEELNTNWKQLMRDAEFEASNRKKKKK